jgi:DNA-binding NarL/FixJ family response regulator
MCDAKSANLLRAVRTIEQKGLDGFDEAATFVGRNTAIIMTVTMLIAKSFHGTDGETKAEIYEALKCLGLHKTRRDPLAQIGGLTRREQDVVELISRGMRNKEAARELRISPRTVEDHRSNAMKKRGVANVHALTVLLMEMRMEQSCALSGNGTDRTYEDSHQVLAEMV